MAKSDVENDAKKEEGERKRDKFNDFIKSNIEKGESALKQAIGLGAKPSVVPVTEPVSNGPHRPVEVGWHPVGGVAGKWLAEDTSIGKMITDKINKYPDPTQHWAVLVGEFAHQLWMDENFDVIYTNERVKREEWQTFEVGQTQLNDYAIKRMGDSVIAKIREKQPAYNLITNNCQTYALQLLDAIKTDGQVEFGTTLAVYERLFGPGKVKDLFPGDAVENGQDPSGQADSVSIAQTVMDQNTTQLDPKEEKKKRKAKKSDREKKKDAKEAQREVEAGRREDQKNDRDMKEKKDVKDKVLSFFGRD
ncbi:DUF862-domain-containing protein [Sarocladium implicatum]|nr:DUF862-domain-containing protein [Sarocladium implicatum]